VLARPGCAPERGAETVDVRVVDDEVVVVVVVVEMLMVGYLSAVAATLESLELLAAIAPSLREAFTIARSKASIVLESSSTVVADRPGRDELGPGAALQPQSMLASPSRVDSGLSTRMPTPVVGDHRQLVCDEAAIGQGWSWPWRSA
jgi:hypothetical protein